MQGRKVSRAYCIILCAALCQLSACNPTTPQLSPAELDTINKKVAVYCGSVEVRGLLAENIARLKSQPTCKASSSNSAGPANELWADDRVSAGDSNDLGVPFELSVTSVPMNRPITDDDFQSRKMAPDHVTGPAISGNGTMNIAVNRINAGQETQYSSSETKVREIYAIPAIDQVCVDAFRTPAGRKPLWVTICRNVPSVIGGPSVEEVARAIIQRDFPLIAAIN